MSTSNTEGEARQACNARFVEIWEARTPFALENEQHDIPPEGRTAVFRILDGRGNQDSMGKVGNRRFLHHPVARLDLWDDEGNGRADLDSDVLVFRGGFEGVTFSGLRFWGETRVLPIGSNGKGKFRLQVDIPFDYQEIK